LADLPPVLYSSINTQITTIFSAFTAVQVCCV